MYPGTGTMVAALTTCIGRPPMVFGKPHPPMLKCILDSMHLNPERTCMVGDRLDTDIAFGKHGGLHTLLVLSGVATMTDAQQAKGESQPDYVAKTLAALSLGLKE